VSSVADLIFSDASAPLALADSAVSCLRPYSPRSLNT